MPRGAAVLPARSAACITAVLEPDVIAYILCRFDGGATECVAWLSRGAATSKNWRASVQLALASEAGRDAYLAAGAAFVQRLPAFLEAKARINRNTSDGLLLHCRAFPDEMRAFAPVEAVQMAALRTLLCVAMRARHPLAYWKKLADVLADVMRALPQSQGVQQRACEAISCMAAWCQEDLYDAGGVSLVVRAMTRFEPSAEAVGALTRLMARNQGLHGAEIVDDVQDAAVDAGVVPLLVAAMGRHPDSTGFISASIQCLHSLLPEHADLVVQAGAADAMFDIVRRRTEAVAAATLREDWAVVMQSDPLPQEALELLIAMHKYERSRHCDFFAASTGMRVCIAHAHADAARGAWYVLMLVEHIAARRAHSMSRVIHEGLVPLLRAVLQRGHHEAGGAALRLQHWISARPQFSQLVSTLSPLSLSSR